MSGDAVSLGERLDALERALAMATGRLDPSAVAAAATTVDKARARLGHGTEHTVVAVAGSTGVGKSSLFNALVGSDLSEVAVRRPTTGVAHAAIWTATSTEPAGAATSQLLDWLEIGRRHHVPGDEHPGLILVDLPDFDSTEATNRAEVDRLVELVDTMIWVTDPQKYADEAFHDGYVRPLAAHGDVMHFVINKIDTVAVPEREAVVADFARRLEADGIDQPAISVTSVSTGDGLDAVRSLLRATIDRREAVVARLVADLRSAGESLSTSGSTDGVTSAARTELVASLGRAAGADQAGDIVTKQHRKDARMAMGWPPVALVERLRRRHPISELPRASASSVARSEIDLALRNLAESVGSELSAPWPSVLRDTASARSDDLTTQLTATTQRSAREATQPPRWWTPVAALQRLVTLVALAGVLWLVVVAVLGGFFQLDTDPLLIDTPGADWIPLPSLMVLGGLLAGLLLALIVRIPVSIAASRRGARVRADMLERVDVVAGDTVLADVEQVLADRNALAAELATATA